MKFDKGNISEFLNSRQQELKAEISAFVNEKKQTQREIEELKAANDEAETAEAFKETAAALKDKESYLEFLKHRAKAPSGPVITKAELKEIETAINEENAKLLDAKAPQIFKKFTELFALLDEYAGNADELQKILDATHTAFYGRTWGGHLAHSLTERNPDEFGYFKKMYNAFLNNRFLIEEVRREPRRSITSTERARLFDLLHKNRRA